MMARVGKAAKISATGGARTGHFEGMELVVAGPAMGSPAAEHDRTEHDRTEHDRTEHDQTEHDQATVAETSQPQSGVSATGAADEARAESEHDTGPESALQVTAAVAASATAQLELAPRQPESPLDSAAVLTAQRHEAGEEVPALQQEEPPQVEVLAPGAPDEVLRTTERAAAADEAADEWIASPVNYDDEGLAEVEVAGEIYRFDSGKQGTALCLSRRAEGTWQWRYLGELRWDGRDLRSKQLERRLLGELSLALRQVGSGNDQMEC